MSHHEPEDDGDLAGPSRLHGDIDKGQAEIVDRLVGESRESSG